jgi:hypothetical protein
MLGVECHGGIGDCTEQAISECGRAGQKAIHPSGSGVGGCRKSYVGASTAEDASDLKRRDDHRTEGRGARLYFSGVLARWISERIDAQLRQSNVLSRWKRLTWGSGGRAGPSATGCHKADCKKRR